MDALLDHVIWHTLTGHHAKVATGRGAVRRYAPGFSPIVAFADPQRPDLDTLAAFCDPGERFYCDGWSGPVPSGWSLHAESTMLRMVWDGPAPEAAPLVCRPLDVRRDGDAALALATLTRPGPFGPRTLELGDYLGCFEGERLVAMAGERMHAGTLREISGVCTHPDHQGRGLARRLMVALMRHEIERGERPFLHVMSGNAAARGLYERMGFRTHVEVPVRVMSRA